MSRPHGRFFRRLFGPLAMLGIRTAPAHCLGLAPLSTDGCKCRTIFVLVNTSNKVFDRSSVGIFDAVARIAKDAYRQVFRSQQRGCFRKHRPRCPAFYHYGRARFVFIGGFWRWQEACRSRTAALMGPSAFARISQISLRTRTWTRCPFWGSGHFQALVYVRHVLYAR